MYLFFKNSSCIKFLFHEWNSPLFFDPTRHNSFRNAFDSPSVRTLHTLNSYRQTGPLISLQRATSCNTVVASCCNVRTTERIKCQIVLTTHYDSNVYVPHIHTHKHQYNYLFNSSDRSLKVLQNLWNLTSRNKRS